MSMTRIIFAAVVSACFLNGISPSTPADDKPVELGKVKWNRDLAKAKKQSASSGKPILVLFQEVPGCQTCQDFGNQPLSHPLLVEAMETLFIPVLVYNNKPEDEQILKSFEEPSWNNPVIRYLNQHGADLIPRKDGVWSTESTARRMVESLKKAGQTVPNYLNYVAQIPSKSLSRATFAMHCYWEGEAQLGSLNGVHSTRSAWVGDKEVVDLTFDEKTINYGKLLAVAKKFECASTVYAHDDNQFEIAKKQVRDDAIKVDDQFKTRDAKQSDQKYYLRNTIYRHLPLSKIQAVKLNAALKPQQDQGPSGFVDSLLSPRQLVLLKKIKKALTQDAEALKEFIYPNDELQLADYDQKLRELLKD